MATRGRTAARTATRPAADGETDGRTTYRGSCPCGRARFEVDLELDHVRSCDCSICRRRGALVHRVEEACLRLLTPLEDLTLYQWGRRTAEDYFCPVCGILRSGASPSTTSR